MPPPRARIYTSPGHNGKQISPINHRTLAKPPSWVSRNRSTTMWNRTRRYARKMKNDKMCNSTPQNVYIVYVSLLSRLTRGCAKRGPWEVPTGEGTCDYGGQESLFFWTPGIFQFFTLARD